MTLLDQMNKSDIKENLKYEPYSFVEWREKRDAEKNEMVRLSEDTALQCTEDPGVLKSVLDQMAKFPQYSAGNILLIQAQKPDATYLADYSTWKDKGMFIRKGERGINVFTLKGEYKKEDGTVGRCFSLKKIFDISQVQNQNMKAEVDRDVSDTLGALIRSSPCLIQLERNDCDDPLRARYCSSDKEITINRAGTPEELFREMSREISLAYLERLDSQEDLGNDSGFTAECSSYVLCKRYGIAPGPELVKALPVHFTQYKEKEVKGFLTRVRYASGVITNEMEKCPVLGKEKEIEAV